MIQPTLFASKFETVSQVNNTKATWVVHEHFPPLLVAILMDDSHRSCLFHLNHEIRERVYVVLCSLSLHPPASPT